MNLLVVRRMIVGIAVLVVMVLFSACAGVGANGVSLSGSVVSVDSTNHTVTLSVNGQNTTIKNVPDNVITETSEGTPEANQTSSANEPGSIQFIGKIASSSNGNVVVSLPDGSSFSMSTNAQTDLGDVNGSLPGVNTQVKVKANANPDGSFTATKIGNVVSSDDPNQVQFQGVTAQAVGSDRVIRFTVGNKSFSFAIGSGADLSDYNGNAQSIASGASVKVTVEFSGTTGSVTKISNPNQ